VGFPEVGLHDVGVDLGGADVGMAEQFLDVADIRPALEHLGGAGVPQRVHGVDVAESGPVAVQDELLPEVGGLEAFALGGDEDGRALLFAPSTSLRAGQQDGPDAFYVFGQVTAGDFADGNDALFAPLPQYPDHAVL